MRFFSIKNQISWLMVYTFMLLVPVSLIVLCDLPAYKAWGYRLDASPLKYLQSPTEAWASVSHLPVLWFLAFWILAIFLLMKLFRSFFNIHKDTINNKIDLKQAFIIFLFAALQIIPMRGGLQLAPMNQSTVYFSKINFANLTAINVTWNFLHSLSFGVNENDNPFIYVNKKKANQLTDSLYKLNSERISLINQQQHPNVILIVWESFTKKVINQSKNGIEITPGFNRLIKEGIYFSDMYATGDRTDKGIVGVLSGYPAQPISSIIKIPQKADKLPKLPKVFLENKYNTSFYYGGELEFANMKSYLLGCGYNNYVSKQDFDAKDQNSKWGAHDGVVENRILKDLNSISTPFFTTWLTLSSHEPYETPVNTVINGVDDESMFLNSMHYSDSIIADFIDKFKKSRFWRNSIIVIVADHGHRLPKSNSKIEDFKIPMLWTGGALLKTDTIIANTGSQIDIPKTLLTQFDFSSTDFIWSKNILQKEPKQWSYFSFNNGFGFVQPHKYFIFDNIGKKTIETGGPIDFHDLNAGKAMQQNSFADYLSK